MLQSKFLSFSAKLKLLDNVLTLPNLITGVRLILTPVIVYQILSHHFCAGFILLFIAGLTDWIDGYFARLCNSTSELGRLLDPIADKILLISVFMALFLIQRLPWWLAFTMIARDILIFSGALIVWKYKLPLRLEPVFISKLNTFFQILLSLCLLIPYSYFPIVEGFLVVLIYGTLTTTLMSGFSYAKLFFKSTQK